MKGNFQLIIIIVFIALAIFGILVFSGAIPIGKSDTTGALGTVVLWGTVSGDAMAPILDDFNTANQSFILQYVQKNSETFDQDLLEALAAGVGPDMILLPNNLVFHYANKIFAIPYQSYSLSSFKSSFASAGEVFLTSKGVLAFPLSIDPLMMYYNRSILDANGVVYPPASWDDLSALVPRVTKKDAQNKIMKSAVAMGHFSNVSHAKDILSALFMQAGNGIVTEKDGVFGSALDANDPKYNLPAILKFYTDFADPSQATYSWNRSFPNSTEAFSKEDVALYFGFASELKSLVNKNPNQNFFVSSFPQFVGINFKVTSSNVMGIAILSSSKNFNTAFTAAGLMSMGDFAAKFATATGTVPARRDLLNAKQTDAYSPIFYASALYSKSWLDPSPKETDDIWRKMIDGVISNSMTVASAISDAGNRLNLLLLKNN